jgi:hypothetical protein
MICAADGEGSDQPASGGDANWPELALNATGSACGWFT